MVLHDSKAAERLLDQAVADGWAVKRIKADAGYKGETVRQAAGRHGMEVQVSERPPDAKGFAPLPLRWRIEATFGTQTNRYRRLTRNLEHSPAAAENAAEIANFSRVLRAYCRS